DRPDHERRTRRWENTHLDKSRARPQRVVWTACLARRCRSPASVAAPDLRISTTNWAQRRPAQREPREAHRGPGDEYAVAAAGWAAGSRPDGRPDFRTHARYPSRSS